MARVMKAVAVENAAILPHGVFAGSWYPLELFLDLARALERVLGTGDGSLLKEIGRYSAETGLRDTYGAFVRQGRPDFIFRRAPAVWGQFYDSGRVHVEDAGPAAARLVVEDLDTPAVELCAAIAGWLEGTVRFSGGEDVVVAEPCCAARGGPRCEFVATWRP